MPRKKPSAEPTVRTRREPVPQPHGGALVPGAGGGPQPGSGRPPDQWKAALRALADRQEVLDHIQRSLDAGPEHPFFPRALDYVTDHGYGKATQPIEANVTVNIADALKAARDRAAKR